MKSVALTILFAADGSGGFHLGRTREHALELARAQHRALLDIEAAEGPESWNTAMGGLTYDQVLAEWTAESERMEQWTGRLPPKLWAALASGFELGVEDNAIEALEQCGVTNPLGRPRRRRKPVLDDLARQPPPPPPAPEPEPTPEDVAHAGVAVLVRVAQGVEPAVLHHMLDEALRAQAAGKPWTLRRMEPAPAPVATESVELAREVA
ncbi:MAG TPA: hypothetical protein VEB59_12755 [Gemmatimonadales bacterium]|nr:hypothetical protein [Gemmatimonadales bacterium]